MGELFYYSFEDLNYEELKEIPRGGGVFVDAWSLCAFFNMDCIFKS